MIRGRRVGEEGYATVYSAGLIAALMSLFALVTGVGVHVAATHRARVGADLAAVAGAQALYTGGQACPVASETAQRNGATLVHCDDVDGDVVVSARIGAATARARAGPL